MRANSHKLSKFWIPSILILFLSPFLLNVIRDEISSLIDSQRNFNRVEVAQAQRGIPDNEVIRADRYSLEEPNSLTQEELVSIVNQAVEAEVSKSFGVTFDLINFLLATLAIIPVVSGLAIWLWNQYFDEKITSKARELVEVEIQKKIGAMQFNDFLDSMNFSIQEITVPRIKEEYRKSFESSFAEGFPFSSSLQKIDQKSLSTIKKYTKLFARLLQNHPDLFREADDYIWAGVAHFILNQPKEAIEFYERAIKKNPGSERAYLSFGNALLGLNQYCEAINKYNKVLELIEEEPPEARDTERHAWAYYNRAKANYELYKYHEAIHDYEEAFNINPNSSYSYYSFYWKGNALSGLGQFLQAIDSYMQALRILKKIEASFSSDVSTQAPNHAWILHSIGDAYRKMGDSCHQPTQQCLNMKGCQVRLENYQKALKFYNSAKDIDSENFEIWQKRGKTNRQMGCYVQAKEDYERAIELCKEEHKPNLLANYASVLKALGESEPQRADQAKQLFKVALDQCEEKLATCRRKTEDNLPDPTQVYYELEEAHCHFDIARCYSLQGQGAKANEFIERAASLGSIKYKELVREWARSDSDFEAWYNWCIERNLLQV